MIKMPVLEVDNVSAGYGESIVIKGMSLELERGELMGIVGPNGSGKTTLFRTMTGLIRPRSGRVYLKGRDIRFIPRRTLAMGVSAVPQLQQVVFPYLVADFILMGRYAQRGRFLAPDKDDHVLLEHVIDLLDLARIRYHRVSSISGGELQRVILAQALIKEPEIMLLDEPTSHLDIKHQVSIMDILKNLVDARKMACGIILHDLNLAALYCDKIALVKDGTISRMGRPEQVLREEYIKDVYATDVLVRKGPIGSKPYVFLVPGIYKQD